MTRVVIGIGSNVDPSDHRVAKAIDYLRTALDKAVSSSVYGTQPEGDARYPYSNAVIAGYTDLTRHEIINLLKRYETDNGRTPAQKAVDIVPIDLDLVVYGEEILRPGDFNASYFMTGYRQLEPV
ncbi:MAG: 2-amino-4-hydroxy-6-hydroxymethyldihydropteridine diphosphokinase [Muribaculaceae bacterium]|nr:2-amino-4-hydroxy-6-hydroxymethyldihydropteridine diphosphokinase [Muribaculaceae bacterium]